jgi:hypothetical protein
VRGGRGLKRGLPDLNLQLTVQGKFGVLFPKQQPKLGRSRNLSSVPLAVKEDFPPKSVVWSHGQFGQSAWTVLVIFQLLNELVFGLFDSRCVRHLQHNFFVLYCWLSIRRKHIHSKEH